MNASSVGAELEIRGVMVRFGGNQVLDGIDLRMARGSITALVGGNGAGKSTLFNVVSGFIRPSAGEVTLDGARITGRPSHRIARSGVGRIFQDTRVFDTLSVLENVLVAKSLPADQPLNALLRMRLVRQAEREAVAEAREMLEFVRLHLPETTIARELSFGQRKRLAIARTLVRKPRVLLLDEPSAGLDPTAVSGFCDLIRDIHRGGVTVWFVEHNRDVVEDLAEEAAYLADGVIRAYGPVHDVMGDRELARLYLGLPA